MVSTGGCGKTCQYGGSNTWALGPCEPNKCGNIIKRAFDTRTILQLQTNNVCVSHSFRSFQSEKPSDEPRGLEWWHRWLEFLSCWPLASSPLLQAASSNPPHVRAGSSEGCAALPCSVALAALSAFINARVLEEAFTEACHSLMGGRQEVREQK